MRKFAYMMCQAVVLHCISDYHALVLSDAYGLHAIVHTSHVSRSLFRGAMITCSLSWHHQKAWADTVHITDQPSGWVYDDIWFLHHVIELLRISLCQLQPEPRVYQLMLALYGDMHIDTRTAQLIFLVRLFFLLGIQPENVLHLESFMEQVAHSSFYHLIYDTSYDRSELREWVLRCVQVCEMYTPLQTKVFYDAEGVR